MLKTIKFEKFTAFEKLKVDFSPGINIFIGENGTGKTHILKAAYAACDIVHNEADFAEKINNVFYPSGKKIGRLVKRSVGRRKGSLEITRSASNGKDATLGLSVTTQHGKTVSGANGAWMKPKIEAVYIPVKDMLANAPSFQALYQRRDIHFEEMYVDIIRKASLPVMRGEPGKDRRSLLDELEKAISGRVLIKKNEEFFLRNEQGELEFTLLAEGYRKLGLLWLLIQNGTLLDGSVLCWDEPETNLNPKLMQSVVGILLRLQRMGVQILLSTHDYVILKEFDLQSGEKDNLTYHSLYRNGDNAEIELASTPDFREIDPNAINDAFGSIIDREIEKSMGGLGK